MATYVYRCPDHGPHELSRAMGTAPATAPCPDCGAAARRSFTAPRLSLGPARNRALIDRTEQTADSPAVVPAPPPSRRVARTAPPNPALARLPRP